MHQGDPTPPTTPVLDPEGGDKTAPLCGGGGATACTHTIIRASGKNLFSKSRIAATIMVIPVVGLAKAEGCDGLACKHEHTGKIFVTVFLFLHFNTMGPTVPTVLPPDAAGAE